MARRLLSRLSARHFAGAGAALAVTAPSMALACRESQKKINAPLAVTPAKYDDMEPLISYKDLKKMCEDDDRIVVAYKGGVYDVTDFTGHPGGVGRLKMAAGGDLEIYWKIYTQHNRGHVVEHVMAPYKIGELSVGDMSKITSETFYDDSAYAHDPEPYPELLINTRYPCNAEGRLSTLTDSWQTPIGRHFVRNHSAVPVIDPEEYTLTVHGEGLKETVYTLKDLKTKFPKYDVTTVIQCNGNRREDFHYYDGETPAFGPPHWVAGAIGCATWSGVRLRDVLKDAGMDVDAISLRTKEAPAKAQQIGLLGYDTDEVGNQYCCSFPFDKAVDPFGDCIVAYQMNGEDIPRPHGYPVRMITPGQAGARNCKYLEKIEVTDNPCKGNSNWKQYAVHAPDCHMRKIAEFEAYKKELIQDPPVMDMPVQSLITQPSPGDILATAKSGLKSVKVKGIAWGGAGNGINRVDVSLDGGKHFTRAEILDQPIQQRRKSQWAWYFFEKEIPIPDEMRWKLQDGQRVEIELTSKALNTAWNVQPENPTPNVNAHGCCVNHWYRVPVSLCPHSQDNVKAPDGDFGNKPSGGRFATPFRNQEQPEAAAERLEKERTQKELCTCGLGCKPGTGCLAPRFSSSPSRLYERTQRDQKKA
jgi:sulfite oxidase